MSRRRNPGREFALRELITVGVTCRRGHLIGRVLKTLIHDDDDRSPSVVEDPDGSSYVVGVSPFGFEPGTRLEFVDEAPSADSGYVVGRCAACTDVSRIGWSRLRDLFDELEAAGESTGEISPMK